MKLPEKFKGIYTEQGQILDAREAKINEIIDYLTELQEQQKTSHDEIDKMLRDRWLDIQNIHKR